MVLAVTRDGLFLEVVKQGAPVRVAVCTSDTLVRDPVFSPILQAAVDDPSASPDADELDAIRERVPTVFRDCSAKRRA